jgi:hypothetical protein
MGHGEGQRFVEVRHGILATRIAVWLIAALLLKLTQ